MSLCVVITPCGSGFKQSRWATSSEFIDVKPDWLVRPMQLSLITVSFSRKLRHCGNDSNPSEHLGLIAEPNWERVADEIGFPCILKPVYGYAWVDVYVLNTLAELKERYAAGAGRIWLVQRKVRYDQYYCVFCIGKRDVLFIKWIPRPLGMGEYLHTDSRDVTGDRSRIAEKIVRLNSCLDMDINVVEWCADSSGQEWVIDALNEVPDMPKERMPPEHYWWIVDRCVACVRDKLRGDQRNKTVFDVPAPQSVAQGGGVQVS